MDPMNLDALDVTRRHFLSRASAGVGAMALASLGHGRVGPPPGASEAVARVAAHHAPKAKRIIYLFQSGGPSQLDLFDHKPELQRLNGEELPDSAWTVYGNDIERRLF